MAPHLCGDIVGNRENTSASLCDIDLLGLGPVVLVTAFDALRKLVVYRTTGCLKGGTLHGP